MKPTKGKRKVKFSQKIFDLASKQVVEFCRTNGPLVLSSEEKDRLRSFIKSRESKQVVFSTKPMTSVRNAGFFYNIDKMKLFKQPLKFIKDAEFAVEDVDGKLSRMFKATHLERSMSLLVRVMFIETCKKLANLPVDEKAGALAMTLVRCCHTIDIIDGRIEIVERPLRLLKDDADRIHSATEAAIVWADGSEEYIWRGMNVPKEWIVDKDSVDPWLLITEPNLERRRVLAEILGWGPIVKKLNPRVVDKDYDPAVGTLLEVKMPANVVGNAQTRVWGEDPVARFLLVKCGTGREFVLRVPPTCKTAIEAQSVMWQVPENVYRKLTVRT